MANGTGGGNASFVDLREAWIGFRVPETPVGIKGGHMLLQLGNGWFFRDMKYGSDAWVVYTDIDALHLGIVNIKVAENDIYAGGRHRCLCIRCSLQAERHDVGWHQFYQRQ